MVPTVENLAARPGAVLVAGCGSMGRRHLENLRTLGVDAIAACDPDSSRIAPLVSKLNAGTFNDFGTALSEFRPSIVLICSPPVFHMAQAMQAIASGADTFIEKPLSHSTEGITQLLELAERFSRVVHVGYNLRFHAAVRKLKEIVDSRMIGRILWARAEVGHYLPNWRPWQDYRESYTAHREMGGGVIFDLSHEIDYITWMLGDPVQIECMAAPVSGLTADVEDSATILLRFASRIHAEVHMDCIQRRLVRVCKLVGEDGTAYWDASAGEICIQRPEAPDEVIAYACDPNEPYVNELRQFLACVKSRDTSQVDLRHAVRVVELCALARQKAEGAFTERLNRRQGRD